ncbi:MAG: ribonuclease P protein component [Betaproteobacteria bacterium]
MNGRLFYPKSRRLDEARVAAAFRNKPVARSRYFLAYRSGNGRMYARLGMVVPKRLLGRAVDRNRVKRLVRERFRIAQAAIAGHDWLIRLVKAPVGRAEVSADVDVLFREANAD